MGLKIQGKITVAVLAFLFCLVAQAQSEQKDSLVRLMKGSSLQLVEQDGKSYRKAIDATFLHNGTFLVCDTALWNVEEKLINCMGNVQLIQEETVLTSDRLDYIIDEDLAQFRGSVVQLRNKKDNILRTRDLDYNTRDSVAIFRGGASMKDKDGQIIECDNGTYEAVTKLFTFNGDVNMFTDSVFVKTTNMTYDSDRSVASFIAPIDFWKDGNMLSSRRGWYNRDVETFFFHGAVHAQSEEQEVWCDTLYYYRTPNDIEMYGKAQVQDTTRNVFGLADYIYYQDSISQVTMEKNAAVAIKTTQNEKVDTLYCGADKLVYHTRKKCDIPDGIVADALKRLDEIMSDPVAAYRKKAQEASEQEAAAEAAAEKQRRGVRGGQQGKNAPAAKDAPETQDAPAPQDTVTQAPADTTSNPLDTTGGAIVLQDTVAVEIEPLDTTKVGFLTGLGRVRMFRTDLQLACDSLVYSDLDSIARFYKEPIIWNEGNRQYTSDSMYVLVRDGGVDRASLMSNAFIATQETEQYFDQIKGTDVMAFFDGESALRRFDALGGATALFYLQENEEFATVNKVESKMLSALLKDGSLERVFYFDEPHNDAYPIVQLPEKEHRMKGFDWKPDGRPKGRSDITDLRIRPSERSAFDRRPRATFKRTDYYFPGYMDSVYESIEASRERARQRELREQREQARLDSLESARLDSLQLAAAKDTLEIQLDSIAAAADTVQLDTAAAAVPVADSVAAPRPLTEREIKAQQRQERREEAELRSSLRIAARDARWAEKDARDAAKEEAKLQRKLERQKAKEARLQRKRERQEARDAAKLQKYIEFYEQQKLRNEGKQKPEPAGERPQGAPSGGELSASPELESETA